ncbi:MAG: DUF429 domain-containing protein [Methanophagales archaeon]|nr:DUF429 domain-containing protein [Methanophagales archaeon]
MSETTIVAVDLAYKGYNDLGIAILSVAGNNIDVEVVKPQHIDLTGPPSASDLAIRLKQLCNERESRVLILDGPQAWKAAGNGLEHCRLCERLLNTPAKTGLPYYVKPRSYEPFVRFSIEVFSELQKRDIRLLQGENDYPADKEVLALESFPLAAWKTLKINPLPAKSRSNAHDITDRLRILKCLYPPHIPHMLI